MRGKYQGFALYRQKRQSNEKAGGFTNWLSPQCGVFGRVLLGRKSKSLLFPGAGGTITNDWCIIVETIPN